MHEQELFIRTLQEASYDPVAILNFVTLLGGGFEKEYSLKNIFTTEELIKQ